MKRSWATPLHCRSLHPRRTGWSQFSNECAVRKSASLFVSETIFGGLPEAYTYGNRFYLELSGTTSSGSGSGTGGATASMGNGTFCLWVKLAHDKFEQGATTTLGAGNSR